MSPKIFTEKINFRKYDILRKKICLKEECSHRVGQLLNEQEINGKAMSHK